MLQLQMNTVTFKTWSSSCAGMKMSQTGVQEQTGWRKDRQRWMDQNLKRIPQTGEAPATETVVRERETLGLALQNQDGADQDQTTFHPPVL